MKATWFQQPLAFLWHLETKRMVWSVLVAIKWDWRAEFWFKQGLSGKECRKNIVMKRLVSSYTMGGIVSGNELLQHQTFYFFLTDPGLIMYKVSVVFMWFSDCEEVWKEWPSPCCRKFLTQHSLGCGNRTSTAFRHFSTRSLLLGADHDIGNFKRRCHKLSCDFKPLSTGIAPGIVPGTISFAHLFYDCVVRVPAWQNWQCQAGELRAGIKEQLVHCKPQGEYR